MRTLIMWLLLVGLGFGAETLAWRVPIELVVEGGTANSKVQRLEKPPGESRFFGQGDELWDVRAALVVRTEIVVLGKGGEIDPFAAPVEGAVREVEHSFQGEWAVWNQTEGLIVFRGGLRDVMFSAQAVGLDRMAKNVRMTIDLNKGGEKSSLSVVGRSGETFKASAEGMVFDVAPNVSTTGAVIDANLAVELPDEGKLKVTTAVTLKNGERMTVARYKEEGVEVELGVRAQVLTMWGLAVDEVVVRENGDTEDLHLDLKHLNKAKIENGLMIRVLAVPRDFLERLGFGLEDPLPELVFEGEAAELIPVVLYDVRKVLQTNGVPLKERLSFAGYHVHTDSLVVAGTPEDLDMAEIIFTPLVSWPPSVVEVELQHGSRLVSITGRSGEKFSLGHEMGGHPFEVEFAPDVAANQSLSDLNFVYRSDEDQVSMNSAATLWHDEEMELGKFTAGGEMAPLNL